MKKINFLMGLHCHQPVDNFDSIFEGAYNKSYEPFLRVLEAHPSIKLSFHYSGSLLSWLILNRPNFIDRIKRLIKENRLEILTGGYFEPILPMVPPEDGKGQIGMLTDSIEKHLGFTPCGAWLAERVWCPKLPDIFKDLNIKYTILDDFHLMKAGVKKESVFGRYTVSAGQVSVFASSKKLRYIIPFMKPEAAIDFLRGLRAKEGADCAVFADDCEKFGFWPYTYDWVYKKGWLDKFFTMLEENNWIRTMTFGEALRECEPLGNIEIPESSYAEMDVWSGASFSNFFKKYPESNLMRNRMLYVSAKLENLKSVGARHAVPLQKAKEELYKAQSNCAYWHGVFGGFYAKHLRQGVYSHIIKAENLFENNGIRMIKLEEGAPDVISLRNDFFAVFMNPDYAGCLFELDYKPRAYNLVNTVARRYEPYHEKIKKRRKMDPRAIEEKLKDDCDVDLYEALGVKERSPIKFLDYDSYQKYSFLCHIMDLGTSLKDFMKSAHAGAGCEGLLGSYRYETEEYGGKLTINLWRESGGLRLKKCVMLEKGPEIFIRFDLENISRERVNFIFGAEFNWSVEDENFMRPREGRGIKEIAFRDRASGIKIEHTFGIPLDFWSFPVYTLNESEEGIRKSFQELSILFHKKLALAKEGKFSLETTIRVSG